MINVSMLRLTFSANRPPQSLYLVNYILLPDTQGRLEEEFSEPLDKLNDCAQRQFDEFSSQEVEERRACDLMQVGLRTHLSKRMPSTLSSPCQ